MSTESERIGRERPRFTIIPRGTRHLVWDRLHDVERGLFYTRVGAERRVWELENAGSLWAGKRKHKAKAPR